MTSYKNDLALKEKHIARAVFHIESGRLASGQHGNSQVDTGCSVGCHAVDYGLAFHDYAGLAKYIGWPEWIIYLQDQIFEGLPKESRGTWHIALAESVPVGVDLTSAYHLIVARILHKLVIQLTKYPDDKWGCIASVRLVAKLHTVASLLTQLKASSSAQLTPWLLASKIAWEAGCLAGGKAAVSMAAPVAAAAATAAWAATSMETEAVAGMIRAAAAYVSVRYSTAYADVDDRISSASAAEIAYCKIRNIVLSTLRAETES